MSFEIEGKVHKIFPTENKTESFQAREFVIQTDGQYPQFVKFQLTQDRCQLIEPHKEGELIKVHFDLRGREWNEKYFTNLNAWRIEKSVEQAEGPSPSNLTNMPDVSNMPSQESSTSQDNTDDSFDDLPF